MRLFHLGLKAAMVGDMTTPHLGAGDLLIVSAGPGWFSTVEALMGVASRDGARTLLVTAQASGACAKTADVVLPIPAQTMADDSGAFGFRAADGLALRRRAIHLVRGDDPDAAGKARRLRQGHARQPHQSGMSR
jgi:D-arabinose 5-phosphate isomerase GutQ